MARNYYRVGNTNYKYDTLPPLGRLEVNDIRYCTTAFAKDGRFPPGGHPSWGADPILSDFICLTERSVPNEFYSDWGHWPLPITVYDPNTNDRGFTPVGVLHQEHEVNISVMINGSGGSVYYNGQAFSNNTFSVEFGKSLSLVFDAQASNGFKFVKWLDNGSTKHKRTVTINKDSQDISLIAEFSIEDKILTISKVDNGKVEYGEDVITNTSIPYTLGYNELTKDIKAIPDTKYSFNHFDVNGISIKSNPYRFMITQDTTVTALFSSYPVFSLDSISGEGKVYYKEGDSFVPFSKDPAKNKIERKAGSEIILKIVPDTDEHEITSFLIDGKEFKNDIKSDGTFTYILNKSVGCVVDFEKTGKFLDVVIDSFMAGASVVFFHKEGSNDVILDTIESKKGVTEPKRLLLSINKTYSFRSVISDVVKKDLTFVGWYKDDNFFSNSNEISIVPHKEEASTIKAIYKKSRRYKVVCSSAAGFDGGTVSLKRSNPSPDSDGYYYKDTQLVFAVTPEEGTLNTISSVDVSIDNKNVKSFSASEIGNDGEFDFFIKDKYVGSDEPGTVGTLGVKASFNIMEMVKISSSYPKDQGNVSFTVNGEPGDSGESFIREGKLKVNVVPNAAYVTKSIGLIINNGNEVTLSEPFEYDITKQDESIDIRVTFERKKITVGYESFEGATHSGMFYINDSGDNVPINNNSEIPYGCSVTFKYSSTFGNPFFIPTSVNGFEFLEKKGNSYHTISPNVINSSGDVTFTNVISDLIFVERVFTYVDVKMDESQKEWGTVSSSCGASPVAGMSSITFTAMPNEDGDVLFDKWTDPYGQTYESPKVAVQIVPNNIQGNPEKFVMSALFRQGVLTCHVNLYNKDKSYSVLTASGNKHFARINEKAWEQWENENITNNPGHTEHNNIWFTARYSSEVSIGCDKEYRDNSKVYEFEKWMALDNEKGSWGNPRELSRKNHFSFPIMNDMRIYPVYREVRFFNVFVGKVTGYEDGAISITGGNPYGEGFMSSVKEGTSVKITALPMNGYMFDGWYREVDGSGDKFSGKSSVLITPKGDESYYAKFVKDESSIYAFGKMKNNKVCTWRSKRFIMPVPFDPSCARVDSTSYPVKLNVYTFSSPNESDHATGVTSTVFKNQDGRRLPYVRRERYIEIEVSFSGEVDAVFVGTSLTGLRV